MTDGPAAADLLCGVKNIASFLGLPWRAVQHRIEQNQVPVFRIGGTIYARRSTLMAWIAKLEREATEAAAATEGASDAR